jgi:hypothetical protein
MQRNQRVERSIMASQPTTPNPEPSPETKIGELREQYGLHFAEGYGNQDTWGEVRGRAGVLTVEEYLKQGNYK